MQGRCGDIKDDAGTMRRYFADDVIRRWDRMVTMCNDAATMRRGCLLMISNLYFEVHPFEFIKLLVDIELVPFSEQFRRTKGRDATAYAMPTVANTNRRGSHSECKETLANTNFERTRIANASN
jgi:hypothetical protein